MFYYKVQFLVFHSDKDPIGGEDWWTFKSNSAFASGQIVLASLKGHLALAIVLEKSNFTDIKQDTIKYILGYFELPVITEIGLWCISAYSRTGISAANWLYLRLLNYPELWLGLDRKKVKSDKSLDQLSTSFIISYFTESLVNIEVDATLKPIKLDKYTKSYSISPELVINGTPESLLSIPVLSNHIESNNKHESVQLQSIRANENQSSTHTYNLESNLQTAISSIINTWSAILPILESRITSIGITSINQVLDLIVENARKHCKIAIIVPEKWWQVYIKTNLPQEINIYLTYEHNSIKNVLSNISAINYQKSAIICGTRELLFITCLATFDKIIVIDSDSEAHYRQQKPRFHTLELILQQKSPIDLLFTSPSIYYHDGKYRIMNQVNIKSIDVDMHLDSDMVSFSNLDPNDLKVQLASVTPDRPVMIYHNRKGYGHLFKCLSCGRIMRDVTTGKIVRSTFVNDQTKLTTDVKSPDNTVFMNTLFGCPHDELELINCGIDGLSFDLMKAGFEVQILDIDRKNEINTAAQIYICTNVVNNMIPDLVFDRIICITQSDFEQISLKKTINRLAWKFGDKDTKLEFWIPTSSKYVDKSQLPLASRFVSSLTENNDEIDELELTDQETIEIVDDYIDIDLQKLLGLPPFGCQLEIAVRVKLQANARVTKQIDELIKGFKPVSFRIFKGTVQTNYRVHIYRALLKPEFNLMQIHPLLMNIRKVGGHPVLRWDRLGL